MPGFPGSMTLSSGVPCISLANDVIASLPLSAPGRPGLWQFTQCATKIGAISRRKLTPEPVVAPEASFAPFLAAPAALLAVLWRPFLAPGSWSVPCRPPADLARRAEGPGLAPARNWPGNRLLDTRSGRPSGRPLRDDGNCSTWLRSR